MEVSRGEEEVLLAEQGSLGVDVNVDFNVELSVLVGQVFKRDGSICEALARILQLSVLSMQLAYIHRQELEEVSWIMGGILALVDVSIEVFLFVDLSLLDLIVKMLDSSPVVVVDGVIGEEDLLVSLGLVLGEVLD